MEKNIDSSIESATATELSKRMANKFPVLNDIDIRDEITQIQHNVNKHFYDQLDISKVKIPCIIFEGKEIELADVFQRLNSGGKKLSKYQVFAAQWDRYDISLGQDEFSDLILNNVIERYEELNSDRGILIENFDPNEMRNNREINLSEFCYGLGKIIADKLYVFFDKSNEDTYNELGFQTMLIVFNIQTNRMNTLPNKHKFLKNPKSIEELVSKIVNVYNIINNKFESYFSLSVLSRDKKYETKSFTRLQILSFFASIWLVSHKVLLDEDKNSMQIQTEKSHKKNRQTILDNIISYAIYDVIRKFWSGTGDRKLMDIYINRNNRYLKSLSKEVFINELLRWNEESVSKASVNIQSDEKMIITVISNKYQDFYHSLNDNLDYEHIFSRKKYNLHKDKASIPAGSLGNIMLLDEGINRTKKEKFLYDVINLEKVGQENSQENKYIKVSFYPEKRVIDQIEIDIIENNYNSLIEMIKNRGDILINELVEKMY